MKAVSVLGVMMIKGMTYFKIGNNKKFSHRKGAKRSRASIRVTKFWSGQVRGEPCEILFSSTLITIKILLQFVLLFCILYRSQIFVGTGARPF